MMPRRRRLVALALCAMVAAPLLGWAAYGCVTWLRFGEVQPHARVDPLMERFAPRYDIAEVHRAAVHAPVAATWSAVKSLDLQESAVIRAIFRGRELLLGATPPARRARIALLDELRSLGWGVLAEVPGRQVVLGAVTRPWEANVVFRPLPAERFASFDSAGYVKLVVTLAADSLGPSESLVRTETRALATDPASRAKFRRYWAIFSPGILLIRSRGLAVVRRNAQRVAPRRE